MYSVNELHSIYLNKCLWELKSAKIRYRYNLNCKWNK